MYHYYFVIEVFITLFITDKIKYRKHDELKPSPIQAEAIPVILQNKDLIGCAQTGTGKTAAYLLPLIHQILNSEKRHLNALIIAPTRELVLQIDQQIAMNQMRLGLLGANHSGGTINADPSSFLPMIPEKDQQPKVPHLPLPILSILFILSSALPPPPPRR